MQRLSQHFMVDEKVLEKIVAYSELREGERVLEVGPGKGALTNLLAEKAGVFAIEKDGDLYEDLLESFKDNCRVEVIEGDVLRMPWPPFDKCVSNLPYRISKPFVLRLLKHEFQASVLVLQKEFVDKMVAAPGDRNYGIVSVCCQHCCDLEALDVIPKNAFSPQPKVESQIVRLKMKGILSQDFLDFLNEVFQRRNRKLGDRRVKDYSAKEFCEIYKDGKGD